MNTYLLLRDNKQSGPMTAAELIAKGLKAYDLVWIEGRSAAWRYPSEIDELKPFSPAIEEQPYDRFFKKSEAEQTPVPEKKRPAGNNAAPRRASRSHTPARKVYINFPGDNTPTEVAVTPVKTSTPAAADPVSNSSATRVFSEAPSAPAPLQAAPPADRRLILAAAAVILLFVCVIGMLILNSRSQRNDIRSLSETIVRMEQRQRAQNHDAQAYLMSHPLHQPLTEPADRAEQEPVADSKPSARSKTVEGAPTVPVTNAASAEVAVGKISEPVNVSAAQTHEVAIKIPGHAATARTEDLSSQVSVKSNKYRTGLFGGVSGLQLVLMNNSAKELSAVSVEVSFLTREKKVVKKQMVNFQNIAPGTQGIANVPKSSRGVSVSWVITDIKS